MTEGRDHWYHELIAPADTDCPAEPMVSEGLLYVFGASGTTGRPRGAIARSADLVFAAELPKLRSGKIKRSLLREVAERRALGDTTTLADPAVVRSLQWQFMDGEG